jgi:hypothetical protein
MLDQNHRAITVALTALLTMTVERKPRRGRTARRAQPG